MWNLDIPLKSFRILEDPLESFRIFEDPLETRTSRDMGRSIALWGSCNGKLEIGDFSFLRVKIIWNIWTRIK